ncbi:MAG TPA: (S)-ureidoglycine aminohydrolase [Candidatus Binatia bacterium]|jgi:(S)-ureidoglycine aminohydrolase|nr:(S)-ureidoglycine aminohydrolase [Candidatus Binatia bacterium]
MNELFGFTRDVVKERYVLRTPSGFVPSCLPGWRDAVCIVQISEGMGAKFCQLLIAFQKAGEGRGHTGSLEFLVYILAGKCAAQLAGKRVELATGSYAYIPPGNDFHFSKAQEGTQLLIFQKRFQPLAGAAIPALLVGSEKDVPGQPFLGNEDARLQVLLPDKPEFDMAVNIFTYQSGATLPFVESHIMEHGLVMLKGQGVYRLDSDWHPVQSGDVIWMAPYCPQWFVAMGKTPASYIYYKDVNRAPLV